MTTARPGHPNTAPNLMGSNGQPFDWAYSQTGLPQSRLTIMASKAASGRRPGSKKILLSSAHRDGGVSPTRLPTPGVRSAGRARRVRPQHEPRDTCAPTRRGAPELERDLINSNSQLATASKSCLQITAQGP